MKSHWHHDHIFGVHAINGISIAHDKTNEFLKDQQKQAKDLNYIKILKKQDVHFEKEHCGQDKLNIVLSDIAFSDNIPLDLSGITAQIFHMDFSLLSPLEFFADPKNGDGETIIHPLCGCASIVIQKNYLSVYNKVVQAIL